MHTTDLSARALVKADVPLSSEERLHEIAGILVSIVLAIKCRNLLGNLASTASIHRGPEYLPSETRWDLAQVFDDQIQAGYHHERDEGGEQQAESERYGHWD